MQSLETGRVVGPVAANKAAGSFTVLYGFMRTPSEAPCLLCRKLNLITTKKRHINLPPSNCYRIPCIQVFAYPPWGGSSECKIKRENFASVSKALGSGPISFKINTEIWINDLVKRSIPSVVSRNLPAWIWCFVYKQVISHVRVIIRSLLPSCDAFVLFSHNRCILITLLFRRNQNIVKCKVICMLGQTYAFSDIFFKNFFNSKCRNSLNHLLSPQSSHISDNLFWDFNIKDFWFFSWDYSF